MVGAAHNIMHVAVDGTDANSGTETSPKLTIAAAIAALAGAPGLVYLHPGVHLLADTLTINRSDLALVGSGANTVLRPSNFASEKVIVNVTGTSNNKIANVELRNLMVDGSPAAGSFGGLHGIKSQYIVGFRVECCEVQNLRQHGVLIANGSEAVKVIGCSLHDNGTNTSVGGSGAVATWDSADPGTGAQRVLFANNIAEGNSLDGLQDKTGNEITYTGNVCTSNGRWGIWTNFTEPTTSVGRPLVAITGNLCRGNVSGAVKVSSSDATSNPARIALTSVSGNTMRGTDSGDGIAIVAVKDVSVTGNVISNANYGIRLYAQVANCENVTMTANRIEDCATAGIRLHNDAGKSVLNCVACANIVLGNTAAYDWGTWSANVTKVGNLP